MGWRPVCRGLLDYMGLPWRCVACGSPNGLNPLLARLEARAGRFATVCLSCGVACVVRLKGLLGKRLEVEGLIPSPLLGTLAPTEVQGCLGQLRLAARRGVGPIQAIWLTQWVNDIVFGEWPDRAPARVLLGGTPRPDPSLASTLAEGAVALTQEAAAVLRQECAAFECWALAEGARQSADPATPPDALIYLAEIVALGVCFSFGRTPADVAPWLLGRWDDYSREWGVARLLSGPMAMGRVLASHLPADLDFAARGLVGITAMAAMHLGCSMSEAK